MWKSLMGIAQQHLRMCSKKKNIKNTHWTPTVITETKTTELFLRQKQPDTLWKILTALADKNEKQKKPHGKWN